MYKLIVFILLAISVLAGSFFAMSAITPEKKTVLSATATPSKNLDSQKLHTLINEYRSSKNLSPLVFDPSMCDFASERLIEVKADWSHTDFYTEAKLAYGRDAYLGENLAREYESEKDTFYGWLDSPAHKANIVNPEYTRTCIVTDTTYVVQEFASN